MYRQVRMNYYSVLALKARVYNWLTARDAANRANASKYAQLVIDAKDRLGRPTFRLGELSDAQTLGNSSFPSEHIACCKHFQYENSGRVSTWTKPENWPGRTLTSRTVITISITCSL